jgi:hypothetical protein
MYEYGVPLTASTGERGHYGTAANRCDRGDLLVATAFELSKYENFSE